MNISYPIIDYSARINKFYTNDFKMIALNKPRHDSLQINNTSH